MNTLESPLEALALNYLRYSFLTAINNIWAWVAVVTAAVGFWRIRAFSISPLLSRTRMQHRRRRSQDDELSTTSSPPPSEVSPATVSNSAESELLAAPTTTGGVWETEWQCDTKTKFTLYYKEEDEDGDGGESEDDAAVAAVVASDKLGDLCPDWERMMAVRMGDMGWYNWQDRTVLDGSVVRLWDGRRRRGAAAAGGGVYV